MKKLFFLAVIFFFSISFSTSAQTTVSMLFQKIKNAPANKYGVQRVNYGTWDTATNASNVWTYFSKKDGFVLCRLEGDKFSSIGMMPKPNQERAEKILKEMDPKKWEPVSW